MRRQGAFDERTRDDAIAEAERKTDGTPEPDPRGCPRGVGCRRISRLRLDLDDGSGLDSRDDQLDYVGHGYRLPECERGDSFIARVQEPRPRMERVHLAGRGAPPSGRALSH